MQQVRAATAKHSAAFSRLLSGVFIVLPSSLIV
jgi:hypothetical protein